MSASCNPKLYRKRQLLAKVQSDCNVLEPLTADDGKLRVEVGQDSTPEVNMNERNMASAYLSNLPNVPGAVMGKLKVTAEVVGTGNLTDRPECGTLLRGCRFREIILSQVQIAVPPIAIAKIARNAIIVGATSGATGRVVVPVTAASNVVTYEPITDVFTAGELIDVQDGDAGVFTTGAIPSDGGTAYALRSSNYELITIRSEEDGHYKSMMNAMGTFSLSAEASGIAKLEFEFTGVVDRKALTCATATTIGSLVLSGEYLYATGGKIIHT